MKNEKKFKFEKLLIWQMAMDFAEELNRVADSFPKKEMFNLSSQLLRAVDSVALNISEGSIGQSNPEFRRFMGYSIPSLAEVVTCPHRAQRPAYIPEEVSAKHYEQAFDLMNMMVAFKRKIK